MNKFSQYLYKITTNSKLKQEIEDNKNLLIFLKTPYYIFILIFELILKNKISKLLFTSMINDNNFIKFLNVNNFGILNKLSFYRREIVTQDYYEQFNNVRLAEIIKQEVEIHFLDVLSKSNIQFNIEDFISIKTMVDNAGKNNELRIYTVIFEYYKNDFIKLIKPKIITNLIIWVLLILTLIIGIIFYIKL